MKVLDSIALALLIVGGLNWLDYLNLTWLQQLRADQLHYSLKSFT